VRPRIFIGSSREAVGICRAVQSELDDDFDVTVWDQDVFRLSYGALDSLLTALDSSDAGVFILRPDDVIVRRDTPEPGVRDNVIFEVGMFIGRLGRDRTFMITPRSTSFHLPSDISGLTTAEYDPERIGRDVRAALGPACTKIREVLARLNVRAVEEPQSRRRLDTAMARMSRDLELLLGGQVIADPPSDPLTVPTHAISRIGPATVELRFGRIEDVSTDEAGSVVALPANEYFDDECIRDGNSSLGAFVQHAFGSRLDEFLREVRAQLVGLPSQRVPRAERRIDDSYGIGQTVFVNGLSPSHKVIVVSATTERVGIGLRAEPHFLYASIQGIMETMNAYRLTSLSMPVFGSGHGGMPLSVALLFNVLALRSTLLDDVGRHIRRVQVVVFRDAIQGASGGILQAVLSRIVP
jgi:hypothetical protein